jgi:FkbM family methyltransferase
VGCHKGEILEIMLKFAPSGNHHCFEPIPFLFENLKDKFEKKARFYNLALSDSEGFVTFNWVKNAPAYSGILKRKYDIQNPDIQEIQVNVKRLDDLISPLEKIALLKIDVEGAEFGVMKGAEKTLKRCKPIVIFECGLGASDFYGTNPSDLYKFLVENCGFKISLLTSYFEGKVLSEQGFVAVYNENKEYAFVAFP